MLKERLAGRRSPLMIQYRLNAGYIALDHWVHGVQGGGRNVGEACHMYDVLRFLAGSPVRSVEASAIDPRELPYARNDNFAGTITYEDGTVGSLVYTALGPKSGLGKEHITVFCDGEAFIVDDFKKLTKASDGSVLWQSGEPDKGHFEELSRLGDALATGGAAPITFEEIVETSAVALSIEDVIHGRAAGSLGVARCESCMHFARSPRVEVRCEPCCALQQQLRRVARTVRPRQHGIRRSCQQCVGAGTHASVPGIGEARDPTNWRTVAAVRAEAKALDRRQDLVRPALLQGADQDRHQQEDDSATARAHGGSGRLTIGSRHRDVE
jgi:hypothetical protein